MSTERYIISGFAGIGKSTAAEMLPGIVIDLESSNFHWMDPNSDDKIPHPEWPMNYVSAARALAYETEGLKDYRDLLYVCISAHREVLDLLDSLDVKYAVAYPTVEAKDEYLQRYVRRGNTPEFIAKLDKNYERFIMDLRSHGKPEIPLETGEYLFDKLNDCHFSIEE